MKGVYPHLFGKNEWEFFTGAVLGTGAQIRPPGWLPKDRHEALGNFAGAFPTLLPQLQLENEGAWAPFM